MAGTTDKGLGDLKPDKHAMASAASQLWLRWCWYTARTSSIGTLLAREILTRLAVVGVAFVQEGGVAAVAAPVEGAVYKFAKHGLAPAETARLAKHPAKCHPREA